VDRYLLYFLAVALLATVLIALLILYL